MISRFDNCLFIHIPKVAGQSIESVFLARAGLNWQQRESMLLRPNTQPELGPPRLAHLTAEEYVALGHITQVDFERLFTFTFVRNPWDRLVSEYLYRKHRYSFKDWLFEHFPSTKDDDYKNATDNYRHVLPQYDFVFDHKGKQLVDFIGRFERLEKDFATVSQMITGQSLALPHTNKTPVKGVGDNLKKLFKRHDKLHYRQYYDEESRSFVEQLYKKDIQQFAYSFDL